MNPLNILVFEDVGNVASGWVKSIDGAYPAAAVEIANPDSFERLLQVANRRRNEWRKDNHGGGMVCEHEADNKDVVVVDYDLLQYSSTIDTTGSRLAYLLRCFTTCGFIVVLNAYGPNPFDLSLSNPSEDFADLHIDGRQIGNPGLWNTDCKGYRPWYWPVIPEAVKNFNRCVNEAEEHLDEPIIGFFGLDRVIDWIPWSAVGFLSGCGKPAEAVTFRNVAESVRSGTTGKDELISSQTARVATARVLTLLNSMILPEQNALVDAPHLISRFPSLMDDGVGNLESLNRLCDPVGSEVPNLLDERLAKYRFERSHWLLRPAWYWPALNRDDSIDEVRDPWKAGEANAEWVFCENVSRFLPLETAQAFRALVSPPFMKRYVVNRYSQIAAEYVPELGAEGILDPLAAVFAPEAMLSY